MQNALFLELCVQIWVKPNFCKNFSFYYKLSNTFYFALPSNFLTFIKGLEKFLIIGWVTGEELVRENFSKRTSQLHT